MPSIKEIGPYHSVDPDKWGENYSERRHLASMEWDIVHNTGFRFSFEEHLRDLASRFSNAPALRVLDGGCGEGSALADLHEIGRRLGLKIKTTGITLDPRHKDYLVACGVNEVVIGSVQHFFEKYRRRNYYHFVLDYLGALSYDRLQGVQGATVIPIYARVLAPGGTALFCCPPLSRNPEKSGLRIIRGNFTVGSFGLLLVTK